MSPAQRSVSPTVVGKMAVIGGGLTPSSRGARVRFSGSDRTVTDGPFAETKEQVGGFIVIEARDLDQAIRLASKIPPIRLGSIEVRPIQELEPRRD